MLEKSLYSLLSTLLDMIASNACEVSDSILDAARSSSAKFNSVWPRLAFAIKQNALIKRLAENAPGIECCLSPSLERAGHDVTTQPASRHGAIDFIVVP